MIRRPPRSTQSRSSAASDVYKRQTFDDVDHDDLIDHVGFSETLNGRRAILSCSHDGDLAHSNSFLSARQANRSSPEQGQNRCRTPDRATRPYELRATKSRAAPVGVALLPAWYR